MSLLSWLPHTSPLLSSLMRWWQASQYPDTGAHDGIIAAQAIMWWPVLTVQAITGGCSHSNQLWTAANMIMITRGGHQYNWQMPLLHPRWWPDFFVFTPWDSKLAKTNPNYSHPFVPSACCLSLPNLKVGPGPGGAGDVSRGPGPPGQPAQSSQIQFLISFKEQEVRLVRCSFATS